MGGARTLVRRSRGAVDLDIEISEVIFVGNGADTRNTVNARLGYQDPANTQHGPGHLDLTARSSDVPSL